jgi:hypothetical protein
MRSRLLSDKLSAHAEVARLGINGAASKRKSHSRENAERLHGRILSMYRLHPKENVPLIVAIGKTKSPDSTV